MTRLVVVVGSSNTDMVVRVARMPAPGETVLGGEFAMVPGGKGANQAVAVARLGGKVQFVGRFGRDVFGQRAIAQLEAEGVGTDCIAYDEEAASGIALIVVDRQGQNCIVVAPGANGRLSPQDVERAQPAISSSQALLVQLEIPLPAVERAAQLARQAGSTVILNPAPARELPANLMKAVDIIVPNETEASLLTDLEVKDRASAESAAQILHRRGPKVVIVTMGPQGALLVTRDGTKLFPAYPLPVVDTTAAGDAFCGGLAWALAEGRSLEEAVLYANAAGSLSVTVLGAQPSLPRRAQVEEIFQKLAAGA